MTNDVGALRRQVQELARAQARLEKTVRTLAVAPRAGYTSIDAGALTVNDDTGAPRVVLGAQPDGSYAVAAVGAAAPVAPSAPVLGAQPGAVSITWDGATDDESGWLADWSHVEAHVDDAPGFVATAENQVGTFTSRAGGTIMVPRPAGPVSVKLTAQNSSGAVSPASAEVTIVVPEVPGPSGSDGNAPPQVTDLSVRGGVGSLYYRWSPVDNADTVTYKLYVRAGSAPDLTDTYRVAELNGTYQPIREARRVNPDTSVEEMMKIIPGIDYHAIVLATDADDAAPASAVVVGQASQVNSEDLALNALTTDHLIANDALFIALQAQTIKGVEIEGGEFRTNAGENRIEIGPSSGQIPIGHIWFWSEALDSPAIIQASSSGTFVLSSGGDADIDGNIQSSGISFTGVGPFQTYTDAILEAQAINIHNGGAFTPEENGIALSADNRLLLEAGSKVEITAPTVTINGHEFGDDTDWLDLTGTVGAGISLTARQYRVFNGMVQVRFIGALTGALAVPANGNIGDIPIGTLPAGSRPGGGGMSAASQFTMEISGTPATASIYPGGGIAIAYVDSRNVAYSLGASGTAISGNSPLYSINS